MTIKLYKDRDKVVDIEISNGNNGPDIQVVIEIAAYSKFLLPHKDIAAIIEDFTEIQNMRSWLFEVYLDDNPNAQIRDIIAEVTGWMQAVAEKYGMGLMTD